VAEVHDGDAVGDVLHDGEVVGNEQVCRTKLLLKVGKEVQHLRLDGDVKGRDGLVADDQLRAKGEGARDAHALALTAGELVRIAVDVLGLSPTMSRSDAT